MGKVVKEFNPFDPSDPMYESSENPLESMAMGVSEETRYAGTNFYPADESPADEAAEASYNPISPAETEFDEIL